MMSHKKDVESAKKLGLFRDGRRSVAIKCMFPPCTTQVQVPAPPEGAEVGSIQHMKMLGGIPMCPKHADMLNFYVWAQTNLKFEAQKTAGGLVLPGHETFMPTLNPSARAVDAK